MFFGSRGFSPGRAQAAGDVRDQPREGSSQATMDLQQALQQINQLRARTEHMEEEKRRLLEAARTTRGSVRVMARVRPAQDADEEADPCVKCLSQTQLEVMLDPRASLVEVSSRSRRSLKDGPGSRATSSHSAHSPDARFPSAAADGGVPGGGRSRTFFFDQLFDADATNEQVFSAMLEECTAAVDGDLVAILAYGATGSGKTHTVSSIARNAARELERQAVALERGGVRLDVSVSIVEIYNDQLRDLLGSDGGHAGAQPSLLRSCGSSQMLSAASSRSVGRADNIERCLDEALRHGQAQRATGSTAMNGRSSRSHLLMTLTLKTTDAVTGAARKCGKLCLVDLAGNERVKKSEAQGDRLKEAQYINKSLSALADVVSAKERRMGHIPYRNSKLTHALQEFLEDPSSRTIVVVALPPGRFFLQETLNTLQFSLRLNSIALQSLQVAAQSQDELRSEFRGQLEEKDRQLEEKERQLQERDALLAEQAQQLAEQKRLIEQLTAKQRVSPAEVYSTAVKAALQGAGAADLRAGAGANAVAPQLSESHSGDSAPTPPQPDAGEQGRQPRRSGVVRQQSSQQQAQSKARGGPASPPNPGMVSPMAPRPSTAAAAAPTGPGGASGANGGVRGRRNSDAGAAGGANDGVVGPSPATYTVSSAPGCLGGAPPRVSRPSHLQGASREEQPTRARIESRQAVAFTYTWDQQTAKPLQVKLDEMRENSGISEEDFQAGLSIMDNFGDEVDLRYHIYKIQFPVSVAFRAVSAVASLGSPQIRRPAATEQAQGSAAHRRNDSRGADERAGARAGHLASSPREYKETVCSVQRARELSPKGDLPPPAASPGYPNQGGYLAISSMVRGESAASLSGDEDDIKEKLRRSLKIEPVRPSHASGTSVSTASGALTHVPSSASAGLTGERRGSGAAADGPLVPLGQQARGAFPAFSPSSSGQSVNAHGGASSAALGGRMTPTALQNHGGAQASMSMLGAPRSTSVPVQNPACMLSQQRGVSHSPRGHYGQVGGAVMNGVSPVPQPAMRMVGGLQPQGVRVASRSPNYG
eukprot:TRINITY_DN19572_c0_g3_i1.p1 TRINITY_DN19572_c0_g3~~TRINITY_DN19572_c0_g3_i1.p1  ORF type:complete len:1049 (+),score=266.13 TRINITY_DN19572_c0_g3_i1:42-3188(+)